ncbi:unnamed protein product [Heligmosomoides polygyrus]|uniref:Secreted protein n=1 Tax=Heligmosomoides polygyrus TaxID=6339 RepID=A0A183F315_HELPZ|nr:unnamed protein product [Heligmosomoides polygyrus]
MSPFALILLVLSLEKEEIQVNRRQCEEKSSPFFRDSDVIPAACSYLSVYNCFAVGRSNFGPVRPGLTFKIAFTLVVEIGRCAILRQQGDDVGSGRLTLSGVVGTLNGVCLIRCQALAHFSLHLMLAIALPYNGTYKNCNEN